MHPYISSQLADVARRRNAIFVNLPRNRVLTQGYEEMGVVGEWAFGKFCGLMPRVEPGRGGDGGYDFQLPMVFTVDVKTSKKAESLLVEVGKVKADIYVLAHYHAPAQGDDTGDTQYTRAEAELVGWTWASVVKAVEPRDTGRGVINHCVPRAQLRPMEELERMMAHVRRG